MRRFSALASAALTLMLAAPVAATGGSTVYLALGDSLAVGDGASVPDRTGYVGRLDGYFHGAAHGGAAQSVNLAVGGDTTSSFLAGQAAAAITVIGDPATDVTVVTLSVGGNDLLNLLNEPTDPCVQDPSSATCQGMLAAALGAVGANYPAIMGSLTTALAADPGTEKIFVLTLYNPFGGTGSPYEVPIDFALLGSDLVVDCAAIQVDPRTAGLNDLVACTSAAFGAIVVDGYAVIGDNALALTHIGDPGFNIHPNDDGYALIAQAHRRADRAS